MGSNNPVYEFLGYKLISSIYSRKKYTLIEYFSIKTNSSLFDEEKSIYKVNIELIIKFYEDELSSFNFLAEFKINDLDWKKQLDNNVLDSLFVSVVFPYIREKIYALTNDSRGAVNLPIIDLRNIVLSKGVKLSPKYNQK